MSTEKTIIRGKTHELRSTVAGGKKIFITDGLLRTARLSDEWYDDVENPEQVIEELQRSGVKADVFTFWQRLPDTDPRYNYQMEREGIAALPIESVEHWEKKQLNRKARNLLRKSAKVGLVIREAAFNDEFVRGMTEIFNESPVRQGKPFWHYGKDTETIKREFSRFLFREDIFAAYDGDELVGFIFLAYAGAYASLGQIISKIKHRDKAPNNALIAKAVEICEAKGIRYLVYAEWSEGTLGDFKKQNGFERVDLPRYYVPLTLRGSLGLRFGLHKGFVGAMPDGLRRSLLTIRNKWYGKPSVAAVSSSTED
ncbi:MAG TPA: hypothetical protein VGF24_34580 [Vicinamibacterales bacterium]